MFPVGKAGGKQRVFWNGTRVILAAARPPAPLHLAGPASFGMLDVPSGYQLRVIKRDLNTWFDQLLLVCQDIGCFIGRPRVSRSELLGAGLSDGDIRAFGGVAELDAFFLVYLRCPVDVVGYLQRGRVT